MALKRCFGHYILRPQNNCNCAKTGVIYFFNEIDAKIVWNWYVLTIFDVRFDMEQSRLQKNGICQGQKNSAHFIRIFGKGRLHVIRLYIFRGITVNSTITKR